MSLERLAIKIPEFVDMNPTWEPGQYLGEGWQDGDLLFMTFMVYCYEHADINEIFMISRKDLAFLVNTEIGATGEPFAIKRLRKYFIIGMLTSHTCSVQLKPEYRDFVKPKLGGLKVKQHYIKDRNALLTLFYLMGRLTTDGTKVINDGIVKKESAVPYPFKFTLTNGWTKYIDG